ncbi:CDP-glycerol glycerophosphotransferase family protein [Arthrobacter rhombi]|uniref:CDP-glycerol glycerophosphotransferase family protein n=1 Tax=Arthrobacter rhombi TaxID=71253 RepID=UPI003FD548A6
MRFGSEVRFQAARLLGKRNQWRSATKVLSSLAGNDAKFVPKYEYYLGNALFSEGLYPEAAIHSLRAASASPENASWQHRAAALCERLNDNERALEFWDRAIEANPSVGEYHYRKGTLFLRLNRPAEGLDELRLANACGPEDLKFVTTLARTLRQRNQFWEEVQLLGQVPHDSNPIFVLDRARALMKMNRFPEALAALDHADVETRASFDWAMLAGRAAENSNRPEEAKGNYRLAVERDSTGEAKKWGPGALFQRTQDWKSASAAYTLSARLEPGRGSLHFRAGFAHERMFEWKRAAEHYRRAIMTDPMVGRWHYKLGLTLERRGQFDDAADAYIFGAQISDSDYWFYRAGSALLKAGRYEDACRAFEMGSSKLAEDEHTNTPVVTLTNGLRYLENLAESGELPPVGQRLKWFQATTDHALACGYLESACTAQEMAILNSGEHRPDLYLCRARILVSMGKFKEAAESYRETRIFKEQDGIDVPRLTKDRNVRNVMEYAEYRETLPLDMKLVLWQSNGGESVACHPLALFREMSENPALSDLKHIWVVNRADMEIPAEVHNHPRVGLIERHSDMYRRALASAGHLINNATFPGYFVRREGQKYLNTWHGTPFKTLGRDMKGEPFKHAAFTRELLQATHVISPNAHTSSVFLESHDIDGIFSGKLAQLGSPRVDMTLNLGSVRRAEIFESLGIRDNGKPIILYAPTWRGGTNTAKVDTERLSYDLQKLLQLDGRVLFSAHRLEEAAIRADSSAPSVIPASVDTNELLGICDVLITDYSSVLYDFLPMRKPIIFYMPDIEEYEAERGLYFGVDELPGKVAYDIDTVFDAVQDTLSSDYVPSGKHEVWLRRFCAEEDGKAAGRATEFFFGDKDIGIVKTSTEKMVLLFQQSLIPTGMSASFVNLVSRLDPAKYHVVVLVEPRLVASDAGRMETMAKLPRHVQIIGRSGGRVMTPEAKWVDGLLERSYRLPSQGLNDVYFASYRLEFLRIFGNATINAAIQFDGYVPFWGALYAVAGDRNTKRITYLHNDMFAEWQMRWPNLEAVFEHYNAYDALVSVSPVMRDVNRRKLSSKFSVETEKFVSCINMINGAEIIKQADGQIDDDLESCFRAGMTTWVTCGRLSVEKDHKKLIEAFNFHLKDYPDSHLLILGSGPLLAVLIKQVRNMGIGDYVTLAGRRPNPHPYVARASAFVLPSNHEGQPMVLLEAMTLAKPILVTDIPGSRAVVDTGYGRIVENSVEGLVQGMGEFERGLVATGDFDYVEYEERALKAFESISSCSDTSSESEQVGSWSFEKSS